MLQFKIQNQKLLLLCCVMIFGAVTAHSQVMQRTTPTWWFGESGAANFNTYRGTTQILNSNVTVPAAFHKGNGVKPYFSLLTEYRPNKTLGGMLNIAYDNRGGKFKTVMAPCNCPADLSTNLSYVTIEPALRLAPFSNAFYVFAGPTIAFNVAKKFTYLQEKQFDRTGEWMDVRKTVFSAQAGAGIDIPLSAKASLTQMTLSPFASFQTDLGQAPRKIESLSIYTIRAGVALKFGSVKKQARVLTPPVNTVTVEEKEVRFFIRAPKAVPATRRVKETFPILNSVFFDMGSTNIPTRYVQLNTATALNFKEALLQQQQPDDINSGRSSRQLAVYYNILNILGDRLRANPQSTITLSGASDKNPSEGKAMAGQVMQYLVNVFGIKPSRITTEGRDKPRMPSEQPGATKELALLREGDRRVDIFSTSPELLLQVGGATSAYLKPVQISNVQENPLDGHVIFTVEGADALLNNWSLEITDEQGRMQRFGPYTTEQASVAGKTILGNNPYGNYKIVMLGNTISGKTVRKESSVSLTKAGEAIQEGLRYTILFDFDRSATIASFEKFLVEVVTPLIADNSTVIIHGHTDIIGEAAYNHTLSHDRAKGAQDILQKALSGMGKKGVKFETYGFGEDETLAPFENDLPEKRFYNRTVIIDIVPNK